MPSPRWRSHLSVAATLGACSLGVCALGACTGDAPRRPADSARAARPPEPLPPPTAAPAASTWDADAGDALVVAGENGEVLVIVPGTRGDADPSTDAEAGPAGDVLPADVALVSRRGTVTFAQATTIDAAAIRHGCNAWPAARLAPPSAATLPGAWTVGFVAGRPTPIALDSIEAFSPGDSAFFAATVTRLASALPGDTARAFRGVPYTVRAAYRFALDDSTEGAMAVVERALNQEAAPLREHLLVVAERARAAPGASPGVWLATYHERASGREEDVVATEVLAAVRLGAARRPAIVLGRAVRDGTRYTLLERADGEVRLWRARWTSVVRGC